jgi:cytochrome c oxidase subunit 4
MTASEHTPAHDSHAKAHPPIDYVRIFVWLTAFTVLELFISFIPVAEVKIPLLVLFAILKATLVVMYYMHLRFDSRWYTLVLSVGVFFALFVGVLITRIQRDIIPPP